MDDKSKLQLKEELEEERDKSDKLYAPMIVKVIVYGIVGIILTTVFAALLAQIIIK